MSFLIKNCRCDFCGAAYFYSWVKIRLSTNRVAFRDDYERKFVQSNLETFAWYLQVKFESLEFRGRSIVVSVSKSINVWLCVPYSSRSVP